MTNINLYNDVEDIDFKFNQPVNYDYKKLIKSIITFFLFGIIAVIVYIVFGNKQIVAGLMGIVLILLTIYCIPFGLFVLFISFSIENAVILNPYFTISKVTGAIVFVCFLLNLYHFKLIFPKAFKYALFFGIWGLISTLWSIHPLATLLFWSSVALDIGLMFIFVNTVRDIKSLYLVSSGLGLGAFVTSAMVTLGKVATQEGAAEVVGRVILSEQSNTVILAFSIVLGFLATFHILMLNGLWRKIAAISVLPLLFYALIRTQSRTPIACIFLIPIISIIMCAKKENRLKYFVIALLLGIIFFGAFYFVLQSDLLSYEAKERLQSQGLEESGRLYFWKSGVSFFLERPLTGWGLGNFPYRMEMAGTFKAAHNTIIAIMAELGLVGIVLIAVIFFTLFFDILKIDVVTLRWLAMAMLLYTLFSGITVTNYIKKDFWYSLTIALTAVNIFKNNTADNTDTQNNSEDNL